MAEQPIQSRIAEVHFAEPPQGGYSYRIPPEMNDLEPGCRVRVSFGNRLRLGFVTKISEDEEREGLKDIDALIDESSLLTSDVFALARWLADYYLCDIGEAIAAAFPAGLKSVSKPHFKLSTSGRAEPWIDTESGSTADLWRALAATPLTQQQIKKRFADGIALLEKFKRRGWIETTEVDTRQLKQSYEDVYRRTDLFISEAPNSPLPKSAVKQQILRDLLYNNAELKASEIRQTVSGASVSLRAFIKRGWLEVRKVETTFLGKHQDGLAETALDTPTLSESQISVANDVSTAIRLMTYEPFLLHGVTSSGKSLIYLEAVSTALEMGRGVIVLVPEISLTPQLAGRLRRRFGELVGIIHSGLQNKERQHIWQMTRRGKIRVVVGPRSAVFAPVENLGLIIVDEEHDDSYKQDSPPPRYHGKAAAFFRASHCGATLLLGSATPDVVSYYNARQGRIKLLELSERHMGSHLPEVRVVKWGTNGSGSLFSPQLRDRIADRIDRNQQTILLVNRRGFATIILCSDCGATVKCPNCDITLRYHRTETKFECHYCGYRQRVLERCPECKGARLKYNGIGTQRVERELELLFPSAKVARLDLDTSRRAGGSAEMLRGVAEGNFDILLGTQMVAKGHDFPNVTLVGILGADIEIMQTDFRSLERSFRLLVQASGRTGRSASGGEVIIQCLNPTHPALRWVQAADYSALYHAEIAFRQPLQYPPFGRLVGITLRSEEQAHVIDAGDRFRQEFLARLPEASLLGPAVPDIERLEGFYRRCLLLKLPSHGGATTMRIKETIKTTAETISRIFGGDKLIVAIDVDPVET